MSWLAQPAPKTSPEPKLELDQSDPVPVSEPSEKVEHDPSFYSDHIVFQVGMRLFKVPRRKFEEGSEVFRNMFALPPGGGVAEGQNDEHPLLLESISVDEFRSLLRAMFRPLYGPTVEEAVALSLNEWIHVLKLATMWSFDGLRRGAIDALRPLLEKEEYNSVLWVTLTYKYKVHEWLLPSLHALARRPKALQVTEIGALGIFTVVKMAEVRESFPFGDNGGYRNSYASRATHNFEQEIRRVFKDDLKGVDSKSSNWRGF